MKFIKTFENFDPTGVDGGDLEVVPAYNPVVKQNATTFVDEEFKKEYMSMIAASGVDRSEYDESEMEEMFDKVREKAIEYYTRNPELIGKEIDVKKFPVPAGDGVVRTNKVGGVVPRIA